MRALDLPQDLIAPDAPDDAPALFDQSLQDWISYGALRERVAEMAKTFAGDHKHLVFLLARNSAACAVAYLAIAAAGHAIMMLDHDCEESTLSSLRKAYRPDWIVAPAPLANPTGLRRLQAGADGMQIYEADKHDTAGINPQLFLLLSTSGSTGSKKFVRLAYRNLAHNIAAVIDALALDPAQRAVLHLPLSYSFGLSVLHTLLACGGSVVLTEASVVQNDFWKLVQNRQCTLFAGVPSHFTMVQRLGLARLHAPTLNTWLQAGGKADAGLLQDFADKLGTRGGKLVVMYGQTEASPRMTTLRFEDFARKSGTVGQALEGGTLEVISKDGYPCPPGTEGEVVYRGPNVMFGYADDRADLSRGDDMRTTLITGDYGVLDEEGFLTITGRKQRMAKIHGLRVMLDEVEAIGRSVTPCAAMDCGDHIVIATDQRDQSVQKQLEQVLQERMQLPSQSIKLKYLPSLPLTGQGKIDYVRLRGLL
ncbi:MAG: AMP-binding protein [Alphaproteobacteria bacterium]|nr:AMP-binding protein [Alphaproteobacteria bacterium]